MRDREAIIRWLRARPLLHREGNRVLVHAGLHPAWTLDEAEALAREAEGWLKGPDAGAVLAGGPGGDLWSPALEGVERARAVVNVLTRMRTLAPDGRLDLDFSGPLDRRPPGHEPWFSVRGRRSAGATVVCGHWAALGLHRADGILALDTGCVWGGSLTACRLDDGAVFQVPADR